MKIKNDLKVSDVIAILGLIAFIAGIYAGIVLW